MADETSSTDRGALIDALKNLAIHIERFPPPVIGSDIFVQAGPSGRAIGSAISVKAGSGGGGGVGQRISVKAGPGQSVIGQRITVMVGGNDAVPPAAGASSYDEISGAVTELRDAAKALETSPASKGWITGILKKVDSWGSAALSGALSGATNACVRFYMSGT